MTSHRLLCCCKHGAIVSASMGTSCDGSCDLLFLSLDLAFRINAKRKNMQKIWKANKLYNSGQIKIASQSWKNCKCFLFFAADNNL